jgi:hypothetical protein
MIFAQHALRSGGIIKPLLLPAPITQGTGLMNPSIFNDYGKLIVNLRHVNYTFYHSEAKVFQHPWGPLTYLHPENDLHLRTTNYYVELNDELDITRYNKIDTSQFDTYEPLWDFVGLEDARLFRWNGKLYTSGVRRDTTTNGQGRMELCEIVVEEDKVTEVSRWRIPPPKDINSYCEKNWMPIVDLPYRYIKWCNPTEIVEVDPEDKTCTTVFLGNACNLPNDFRGGSQVIRINDYYVTLVHEVSLFNSEVGRKDAVYLHRFVVWDDRWNLVKYTDSFSLMGAHVEFSAGMCKYNDDIIITFGYQDNAAFACRLPVEALLKFINL